MIKELFDVQHLDDYDYDRKRLIIEPKLDGNQPIQSVSVIPFLKTNNELGDYIASKIDSPESGTIYVIADKNVFKRFYVIYIKEQGKNFGKIIQYKNENNATEINFNLNKGDYNALKETPIFAQDESDQELAMFMAAQEYVANQEGRLLYIPTVSGTEAVNIMLQYLKNGLWYVATSPIDITTQNEITYFDLRTLPVVTEETIQDSNLRDQQVATVELFGTTAVVIYPNTANTYGIVIGDYQAIKKLYIANTESMLFGGATINDDAFTKNINIYLDQINTIEKVNAEKQQAKIAIQTPKSDNPIVEEKIIKQQESNWDAMENILSEPLDKLDKKKNNKPFVVESEIGQQEQGLSQKEVNKEISTEANVPKKINARKRTVKIPSLPTTITKSVQKISSSSDLISSIPDDWDYVYSIKETSAMYNLTVGKTWDIQTKTFRDNDEQKNGMTIPEWNAYFVSNPQYAHLIEHAIGQWGGITQTEKQLMEEGSLLYNPKTKKVEYIHEYLKGNGYDLLKELEVVKEFVIATYSEDIYNTQKLKINQAIPIAKLINEADADARVYISPLDDVNIGMFITSIKQGTISYPRSLNRNLVRHQKQDEKLYDLALPQELNILIFFKYWLQGQENHNKYYIQYEIPLPILIKGGQFTNDELIDAVEIFYFGTGNLKSFADYAVNTWKLTNTKTAKSYATIEEVDKSDFFEFKDNLKAMVNQAFQDFIFSVIEEKDRNKLERLFNERYNGFIKIKVDKYPVFIRHRKYFKNIVDRATFILDQSQVDGLKFGTINNSSIMAHEVGYGKTSLSIEYMSHIFETNQASNILVVIPKSLYDNRKWKEEVSGNENNPQTDPQKDTILGLSPPDYNVIELGNLTPSLILGKASTDIDKDGKRSSKALKGKSPYKTYLFDDIVKIEDYKFIRDTTKDNIPSEKDAYLIADYIAEKEGMSDIVMQVKTIDPILYEKCKGTQGEYYETILDLFDKPAAKFWKVNPQKQIQEIVIKLIEDSLYDTLDSDTLATITAPGVLKSRLDDKNDLLDKISQNPIDIAELKRRLDVLELELLGNRIYANYFDKQLDLYLRDVNGKIQYVTTANNPQPTPVKRPYYEACEDYIIDISKELHQWVNSLLNKIYENSIYQYGTWNFNNTTKNIFLVTHDAIKRVGFSQKTISAITDSVKEFSSYTQNVEVYDELVTDTIISNISASGIVKASKITGSRSNRNRYNRGTSNQKNVLEKQYAQILQSVNDKMTSDGEQGKLLIDDLNIDGFIYDEAHKGKKLFTNAVSSSVFDVRDERGTLYKIKKSSHDIHGGGSSTMAILMFGVCQYIRSLGPTKPIMLLTATPFSNQPTEIFTMLAMVGVKQLREQGVANVKNFFDLFLNETLKYTFDHTGQFVKRITVEDFRNKELLLQMIWSIMDIKREVNAKGNSNKPQKIVYPKLNTATSFSTENITNRKEQKVLNNRNKEKTCDDFKTVTTSVSGDLKKDLMLTASIVSRNQLQVEISEDLERVALQLPNYSNPKKDAITGQDIYKYDDEGNYVQDYYPYNFNDICPTPIELRIERDTKDIDTSEEDESSIANNQSQVDKALVITKNINDGRIFKTLQLSQAMCLSPYFYSCKEMPDVTPENIVFTSPKIEYLVKALESVKNYHTIEVPKEILNVEKQIKNLEDMPSKSLDDNKRLTALKDKLPGLKASLQISGQVVYTNKVRFSRIVDGKKKEYNLVYLIKQYLIDNNIFTADQIGYVGTGGDNVEKTIKDFQSGKILVLFGTPAIKEGVDLQQNGATLYIMTPDWNPTDMRQIEGRIWRRGNPYKTVRIVYVLLDQSVEIFIYAKLEEKALRLSKIMQERNDILDASEMSLDPRETQVALASDPQKRVDIITKTCLEILKSKLIKARISAEALDKITKTQADVSDAIEDYYKDYMIPYWDEKLRLQKEYSVIVLKEQQDLYDTDKPKFVKDFVIDSNTVSTYFSSYSPLLSDVLPDHKLFLGFSLMLRPAVLCEDTQPFSRSYNWTTDMVIEYLTALKHIIDNKNLFLNTTKNDYVVNKEELLDSIMVVSFLNSVQERDIARNYAFGIFDFNKFTTIVFKGAVVLSMPTHLQKLVLSAIEKILNSTVSLSRREMGEILDTVTPIVVEDMAGYVAASAYVSPQNSQRVKISKLYIDEAESSLQDAILSNLPTNTIIKKAIDIIYFDRYIGSINNIYTNLSKPNKTKFIAGDYKKLTTNEFKTYLIALISPKLGFTLDSDSKLDISNYEALYDQIKPLGYSAKEIKEYYQSKGIAEDTDIDEIVEQANKALEEIEDSISLINSSKEVLLKKYKDEQVAKKDITLDIIIKAFSTNNPTLSQRETIKKS